jgi:hypothetical protein
VESLATANLPVEKSDLSTAGVHRQNGSGRRREVVLPGVHTPYCYYELI